MRKKLICCLLIAVVLLFAGCRVDTEPKTIVLSFDRNTAYFSGTTELLPIKGDTPSEGDRVERAEITIKSDGASKMQLCAIFEDGSIPPSGLMIAVDGSAHAFVDNVELYVSESAETEKTLTVTIYMSRTAQRQDEQTVLKFLFELNQTEG